MESEYHRKQREAVEQDIKADEERMMSREERQERAFNDEKKNLRKRLILR